ncbi:hypothetical protein [Pseudoxanthomonas sp. GM95]|uniref:hypothetical protein n=1 Tax=Pseudoxanthomonas sp. GM95 TaxID=1881043 RepID=UPI00111422EB|nr:hypothetical protein [Pseudoxanthomonas sp. GM95]
MLTWALASGAAADTPPCAVSVDVLPEHLPGLCAQPPDVRAFVERHDRCVHFAGEDPYDEARRAELAREMQAACSGAGSQFKSLLERYRDQPDQLDWLQRYGRDVGLSPEG